MDEKTEVLKLLRDAVVNTPALDSSEEWTALVERADQVLAVEQDGPRAALMHLRLARDLLAGSPKARERVRRAIASTEGAVRHADLAPYRTARQSRKEVP